MISPVRMIRSDETDNMENFTFDEKGHKYTLDGKPLSGVTTVLGVIAKPALIQWAADMACKWVEDKINESPTIFDYSGSEILSMLPEARLAHRKKKEKAGQQGTDTHALVEKYVKLMINDQDGKAMEMNGYDSPAIESFVKWAVENKVKFIESEKRMYSREWWLAGTCDLVFEQDGKRYVGDIKTMKKIWDRVPFLQMAAYMKMLKETDPVEYHGTCIINIPKETNQVETAYSYDFEGDIKAFEAALTLYRALQV